MRTVFKQGFIKTKLFLLIVIENIIIIYHAQVNTVYDNRDNNIYETFSTIELF